ncbi:kanadaptin [Drosophila sulfurigaster albostrigata]|uniref:kanadaptin n=1 Tax=Drosophila sulfurigaster albostrigata TaxID=89887 RepID=UPI002D21BF6C|nr:kanadaptin [Drosophila sulfurigaster albostrigata]
MDDFKVPVLPSAAKSESVADEKPTEETPVSSKTSQPTNSCPYKVPKWSQPPAANENYKFEVLKSGQIIDEVKDLQQQAVWTFGRLPENDVFMAHPTISRYHAVLQYKPKASSQVPSDEEEEESSENAAKPEQPEGWYIYDLGSTHGTFLNKQRVPPRVFIRIRVGHMLKLGNSTRVYILQGPSEDEEPESELTVTELREQRDQQVAAAAAEKVRKAQEAAERERNEGVSWGMGEDADEETDLAHNPYASTNNEDLFFDDPKRTLRGFFEREGLNLEYKCDELSQASFVCRVELPIDDSNGRPIIVEVTHKGRKKDCVVQCALEACRTLDRHGVLRQANQESQKRKIQKTGDSDDEDEFWDRTGDVARKKQRKANAGASVTLTYDDLLKQESELNEELQKVEQEITAYQQNERRLKELAAKQQSADDDLDNFMDSLSENVTAVDKTEIKKLRLEEQRIRSEKQKLQRLIKIAKPTALPFLATTSSSSADNKEQESSATKKQLPMIGKRNQFSKFKVVKAAPSTRPKVQSNVFEPDGEEVEEEEEAEKDIKTDAVAKQSSSEDAKEIPSPVATEVKSNNSMAKEKVVNKCNEMITEAPTAPIETPADVDTDTKSQTETEAVGERSTEEQSSEEAAHRKQRRQRARQRNKQRQDVDMDLNELAEHEDDEKYAKWVPPTNQSGDGITHLNDKFGY